MKTNLLILFIAFSSFNSFAQFSKNDIIIQINGNYMKTKTEYGVTTNQSIINGQYLNTGISVGSFMTNRFFLGIGADYSQNKETRYNLLNFNDFLQEEELNTKTHGLLPSVFLGYYYRVLDKLYFNTNLKFSLGKIKSDYTSTYAGGETPTYSDSLMISEPGYLRGSSNESDYAYFSTQLCPELSYFFSTNFGLSLGLGGIEYSMIDWKTENSIWAVNFNPVYWKLGIRFKIHVI